MIDPWIDKHVTAQLIDGLAGGCAWVRMEASPAAALDEVHPTGSGQPKHATLAVLTVTRGHNDRHSFIQHHLVAILIVNVN